MDKFDVCVILCGGNSRRMGSDKALLDFGGVSLLVYQFIKNYHFFNNVFISAKENQFEVFYGRIAKDLKKINSDFNVSCEHFLLEEDENSSPLFGINNAFLKLDNDRIFFLSCDSPFVSFRSIKMLHSCYGDVVMLSSNGKIHPLLGIWSRGSRDCTIKAIREAIAQMDFKITNMLKYLHCKTVECDYNETLNLNTPNAYKDALRILKVH